MALVLKDRVKETSTSTGPGPMTLAGAVTGYQTFSSAIGNTNTTYYCIANSGTSEWEVGIGTYSSGTNSLSRDTILASSNSGSVVSFSSGTKEVFVVYPAGKSVYADSTGNVSLPVNLTVNNNTVLGSTSSNTLTINGTAVSIPNNLNFDSSTLYIDALNNRVGIGTNLPNYTLQVQGTTQLFGDVLLGASILSTLTITAPNVTINNGLNFDSNTFVIDSTNNRVGVGTATPSVALDVAGSTRLGSLSSNTLTITGTAVSVPNNLNFDSNTLYIDATNNRVGVGTASPSYRLHVSDNTAAAAQIVMENIGGNAPTKAEVVALTSGATTYMGSAAGTATGNTLTEPKRGYLYSDSINAFNIGCTGGGSIQFYTGGSAAGNIRLTIDGATGNATFANNVSVNGNTTLGDANTDTLTINGTAVSVPNNLNFDSNTLYIDATNNRVGVGTATPAVALDVSGNASATALVVGNGPSSATPIEGDINATDGSGTNIAGAALALTGGRGTGNAAGGAITFATSPAGQSGAVLNNATTRMTISSTGAIGFGLVPVGSGTIEIVGGTNSKAPLKFNSGSFLTTPTAGVVEYDGTVFYTTNDTTSDRGLLPSSQIFRLDANGAAIGPAINNFFGANSAVELAAGGIYELEAHLRFTKTTAGTVTVTLTTSAAPVNLSGTVQYGAATGGTATGAANQISLFNSTSTAAAFGASASLTTAVNHAFIVRAIIEANAVASNLRINVTSSAGTVTPLQTSYYKLTKLPTADTGSFVA